MGSDRVRARAASRRPQRSYQPGVAGVRGSRPCAQRAKLGQRVVERAWMRPTHGSIAGDGPGPSFHAATSSPSSDGVSDSSPFQTSTPTCHEVLAQTLLPCRRRTDGRSGPHGAKSPRLLSGPPKLGPPTAPAPSSCPSRSGYPSLSAASGRADRLCRGPRRTSPGEQSWGTFVRL